MNQRELQLGNPALAPLRTKAGECAHEFFANSAKRRKYRDQEGWVILKQGMCRHCLQWIQEAERAA